MPVAGRAAEIRQQEDLFKNLSEREHDGDPCAVPPFVSGARWHFISNLFADTRNICARFPAQGRGLPL